jgi:hypothetical protein
MNCPNCGFYNQAGANFCQNCGYRFDDIPQVEPIRVVVPQTDEPEPPTVVAQQPPPVVIRQKSAVPTGLIIFLTVLVTLAVFGGLGLAGFYLYTRSSNRNSAAINADTVSNANIVKPSPSPSPDYEQRRDEIAPPDKRVTLIDEQFEIAAGRYRAVPFTVDTEAGARIAGGFRVTKGKTLNFLVFTAENYEEYPSGELQPLQETRSRNKIINSRLKQGDYYLVFENNEVQPITTAAEFFVVYD